jgi:CelD/BcsL family acetyltransferase involved in cellulose biosynthesis
MCPACLTAAVMTAAGTASGASLLAVIVARWRRLWQWLPGAGSFSFPWVSRGLSARPPADRPARDVGDSVPSGP